MHIDPAQQAGALAVIDRLMQEVKGIKAVVVSTEDGFEIASRTENTAQVARLSAVARNALSRSAARRYCRPFPTSRRARKTACRPGSENSTGHWEAAWSAVAWC